MARWTIGALVVLVVLFAAAWVAALQVTGPPVVCVINGSAHSLVNIVVTTSAGERSFGNLEPRARRCHIVEADGGSGLAISLSAVGQTVSAGALGYLENSGGFCEVVTVDVKLHISSSPRCPSLESLACRLTRGCS